MSSGYTLNPRSIMKVHGWEIYTLYNLLVYYASWEDGYKDTWKRGQLVKSSSQLAENSPFNEQKVKRLLSKMVDLNLITKVREGRKTGTRITILDYETLTYKQPTSDLQGKPQDDLQTKPAKPLKSTGKDPSLFDNDLQDDFQVTDKQPASELPINKRSNELTKESKSTPEYTLAKYADDWNEICKPAGMMGTLGIDAKWGKKFKIKKEKLPTRKDWINVMKFMANGNYASEKFTASVKYLLRKDNLDDVLDAIEHSKNGKKPLVKGTGTDAKLVEKGLYERSKPKEVRSC